MDQEMSRPNDIEEPAEAEKELSEADSLRREVEDWHARADEWKDQYLRSAAEFANYRKRIEREREQLTVSIGMNLLKKVLPAIDDLDRALKSVPCEYAEESWVAGVALIFRKLETTLREFQAMPIEALGKPFDPNVHMAVTQEASDEFPAGTVMEELRKGYMLGGQVLRPTLVKVSTGPGPQGNAQSTPTKSP